MFKTIINRPKTQSKVQAKWIEYQKRENSEEMKSKAISILSNFRESVDTISTMPERYIYATENDFYLEIVKKDIGFKSKAQFDCLVKKIITYFFKFKEADSSWHFLHSKDEKLWVFAKKEDVIVVEDGLLKFDAISLF